YGALTTKGWPVLLPVAAFPLLVGWATKQTSPLPILWPICVRQPQRRLPSWPVCQGKICHVASSMPLMSLTGFSNASLKWPVCDLRRRQHGWFRQSSCCFATDRKTIICCSHWKNPCAGKKRPCKPVSHY